MLHEVIQIFNQKFTKCIFDFDMGSLLYKSIIVNGTEWIHWKHYENIWLKY